jgi:hypothetical protein
MRKLRFFVISVIFVMFAGSCGPPGIVVYEKMGSTWQVKEVHLNMQNINKEALEQGKTQLEDWTK